MRRGILTLVVVLVAGGVAHADRIDLHVRQLRNAGQYKLRLSAALKLSRVRDARAVAAMADALINDHERAIRQVAALSLRKMVDESLPLTLRKRVIASLERARDHDRDRKVRQNAADTLQVLAGIDVVKDAKVFLYVGKPADLTHSAPRDTSRRMHLAVRHALRQSAPDFAQEWPTGKLPTKAQLANSGAKAFFVGSSVSMLRVARKGGRAEVRCAVSVRVSPWEGRDGKERWQEQKTASATGNGKVIGSSTPSGIASAKRDCVLAVAEQITARQVVPFLNRLAR